jgi:hypothetical protein
MVIPRLDKLKGVPYMNGKLWIFTFQCNWDHIKIHFIAPIMAKTLAKGKN